MQRSPGDGFECGPGRYKTTSRTSGKTT